jgi:cytochrome c-type biogenesis protein
MTSSLPLPMAAFVAGLVSFVTPCVLPLVPGYISLVSGASAEEIKRADPRMMRSVLLNAVLFIAGFTVVFMALGAVASGVGHLVQRHIAFLSKAAGAIIVAFGLHKAGIVTIPALYRERRPALPRGASFMRAFLVGFGFGFGWTPCVGPILTVILTLAASEATIGKGVGLLTLYSAGLALPFLLTALCVERFLAFYHGIKQHLRTIEVASGLVMVALGALIFTQRFTVLNSWMNGIPLFRHLSERFL